MKITDGMLFGFAALAIIGLILYQRQASAAASVSPNAAGKPGSADAGYSALY